MKNSIAEEEFENFESQCKTPESSKLQIQIQM